MTAFDSLSMSGLLQSCRCKLSPLFLLRPELRPGAVSASGHLHCLHVRKGEVLSLEDQVGLVIAFINAHSQTPCTSGKRIAQSGGNSARQSCSDISRQ